MTLIAFTIFHTLLSLAGIASGFVVMYGFLTSRRMDGWAATFLGTMLATTLTGFLFPFHGFTPAIGLGILTTIDLLIAYVARYQLRSAGVWRRTYVISTVIALYFDTFVLVAQMFQKIPVLKDLAPTQTETPFKVAQISLLLVFLALGTRATMKFQDAASL